MWTERQHRRVRARTPVSDPETRTGRRDARGVAIATGHGDYFAWRTGAGAVPEPALQKDEQHERRLPIGERLHRLADAEERLRVLDADTSFAPRDANLARLNERPASRGLKGSQRLPIGPAPSAAGTRCTPGEYGVSWIAPRALPSCSHRRFIATAFGLLPLQGIADGAIAGVETWLLPAAAALGWRNLRRMDAVLSAARTRLGPGRVVKSGTTRRECL